MTIPGLLLGGTKSSCGKSTIMAGITKALMNKGLIVAPFKVGPDYLDPMLHKYISKRKSWNLDSWLLNDNEIFDTWTRGSLGADLAIVEGVMGIFDGIDCIKFEGSSADIANKLNIPIVLIADAAGVSYSIAATVLGFIQLIPKKISGIILNNVKSERHFNMLNQSLITHTDIKVLGWSKHLALWQLPERHLGIFNPNEILNLSKNINLLAHELSLTIDLNELIKLAKVPQIANNSLTKQKNTQDLPVAIAKDKAFSFIYSDTLDRMERLGVKWIPFSPLTDDLPKNIAGVYIPGGYPELYSEIISNNKIFLQNLKIAHSMDMPILAECGGYMLLTNAITNKNGITHTMANIIPGRAVMTNKLQSFGYKELVAIQNTLICNSGDTCRAHEFHHSIIIENEYKPAWHVKNIQGIETIDGYVNGNLLASYAHIHFGSKPEWANTWVSKMRKWLHEKTKYK